MKNFQKIIFIYNLRESQYYH